MRDDYTIDPATEQTILDVPTSRGLCCHVGGDIDFDAAGNLYLSTGDDTNPFDSDGYAPIDERADRNPAFDAQRTAGNTNDLRGKVLRIKPSATGGYTIPAGNLFAPGTANTRPEIYAMGFRNPFRISVDKATGVVYLGDYGPDAGAADPNRGPGGHGRVRPDHPARATTAGRTAPQLQRRLQRVQLRRPAPSGAEVQLRRRPTNNSPNNTGLTTCRRRRPPGCRTAARGPPPELGGGGSPMGGPVYHYNAEPRLAT